MLGAVPGFLVASAPGGLAFLLVLAQGGWAFLLALAHRQVSREAGGGVSREGRDVSIARRVKLSVDDRPWGSRCSSGGDGAADRLNSRSGNMGAVTQSDCAVITPESRTPRLLS